MSDEKPLKKPRKAPKKAAGDAPADDPKLGPTLPAWTTLAEWIDTLSEAEMAAYIATPGAARAAYQAALEKRDPLRARLFQAETLMLMQEVGEPTPPPSADPAGIAERDRLAAENERLREQQDALRAELAKAALELHQRSIIPFGTPQPPPGPVPAGDLVKVVAMNVKLARVGLGLSQDELAADSGIGRKQISAIENGANTTIETIERLARHLQAHACRTADEAPLIPGKRSALKISILHSI